MGGGQQGAAVMILPLEKSLAIALTQKGKKGGGSLRRKRRGEKKGKAINLFAG